MADNTICHLFDDAIQITTKDLTHRLDPGETITQEPTGRILLGKLICRGKIRRIAIENSLKRARSSFKGWSWKEDEIGILHFTFASREDAWNVLQRRLWVISGALLIIMSWQTWLSPREVIFDKSPFWVRISGIPPYFWNKTNLEELATKVSPMSHYPERLILKEVHLAWVLLGS